MINIFLPVCFFLCDVMISHRSNMPEKPYLCSITFDQFDCCSITAKGQSISNYLEQSQVYSAAGPLHCVQGKDIICKYKSIAFFICYLIIKLVVVSEMWLQILICNSGKRKYKSQTLFSIAT